LAHIPKINSDFEKRLRELPPPGHYRQSAPSLGELRNSHNSIAASFGALHLDLTTGVAADKAALVFRNAASSWDRATQDYTLSGDLLSQHYSSIQKELEQLQMPTLSLPNHSATSLFETLRVEKPRSQEPDARAKVLAKWKPKAEPLNFPKAPELEKCLNDTPLIDDDLREMGFSQAVAQTFESLQGVSPSQMLSSLSLLSQGLGIEEAAIETTARNVSEALQHCSQVEERYLKFPQDADALEQRVQPTSHAPDALKSYMGKEFLRLLRKQLERGSIP